MSKILPGGEYHIIWYYESILSYLSVGTNFTHEMISKRLNETI